MNSVIMIGRLVANPELKQTTNGRNVTNFKLAVETTQKNKADFFTIIAWEKTAEFITNYFHQGERMALQGRLQTRHYEKNGVKVPVVEILAERVEFCERPQVAPKAEDIVYEDVTNAQDLPFDEDNSEGNLPF